MEGKYLVTQDSPVIPNSAYGAVNPCCEVPKENDSATNALQQGLSTESQINLAPRDRSCSCTVQVGECDCGVKKRSIQLEPWAKYKTVVMGVGLSLFAIWVITMSVVGGKGQL